MAELALKTRGRRGAGAMHRGMSIDANRDGATRQRLLTDERRLALDGLDEGPPSGGKGDDRSRTRTSASNRLSEVTTAPPLMGISCMAMAASTGPAEASGPAVPNDGRPGPAPLSDPNIASLSPSYGSMSPHDRIVNLEGDQPLALSTGLKAARREVTAEHLFLLQNGNALAFFTDRSPRVLRPASWSSSLSPVIELPSNRVTF